jgi:hypothetical protein
VRDTVCSPLAYLEASPSISVRVAGSHCKSSSDGRLHEGWKLGFRLTKTVHLHSTPFTNEFAAPSVRWEGPFLRSPYGYIIPTEVCTPLRLRRERKDLGQRKRGWFRYMVQEQYSYSKYIDGKWMTNSTV